MKLSVYTGLVIGPMMIGAGITILMSVLSGRSWLADNEEVSLLVAAGFGAYGLFRLVRSITALIKRGEE